jgi:hypothetical protein
MDIIPVTSTVINWNELLLLAKKLLGRNVTEPLEEKFIKVKTYAGFLSVLSEMHTPGMKINNSLLDHLHFGVMVVSTQTLTYELIQESRLDFTLFETIKADHYVTLFSGKLSEWKNAIINCSSATLSYDIRLFGNTCMRLFESNGLNDLFSQYDKDIMPDQTYKLTLKRGTQ